MFLQMSTLLRLERKVGNPRCTLRTNERLRYQLTQKRQVS